MARYKHKFSLFPKVVLHTSNCTRTNSLVGDLVKKNEQLRGDNNWHERQILEVGINDDYFPSQLSPNTLLFSFNH